MSRIRNSLIPAIAGFALLLGSCGREAPTAPPTESVSSQRKLRVTAPVPTVVYGPATFTRDNGKPRTDSASFGARAGDTLTFVLASGAVQGLNATVDVNGTRLFSSSGGRGLPDSMRVVARETNSLRVWMGGKPGSSLRIVASVPGQPVPVETRVLSVMYESSVLGSGPAGDTALALGTRVHYRFVPHAGFRQLRVVVDGQLAPDSGTLTMDRAHWIAASADTVIALDQAEQPLAQQLRSVLTGNAPREAWRTYQAAIDQAAATWGVEADVHLARIEAVTIDPVNDLANLVRLDSALAGMETPIELSPAVSSLREGAAQAAVRVSASSRRTLAEAAPGTREETHILLVNGIITSERGLVLNVQKLGRRLAEDPVRFPPATTTLSHLYNPSFFNLTEIGRAIYACHSNALRQATARRLTFTLALSSFSYYLTCLAAMNLGAIHANDFSETLRWSRAASSHDAEIALEADNLARLVRSYQVDARKHVLIVAHSEGSLMAQLAVQRLKDVYGFDEGKAPRCVGTVSVAGVGTGNWPLSDRHSRFVVATHDFVTFLPGDLGNRRPTTSDADVRAYEAAILGISLFLPASAEALAAALVLGPIELHALSRYLASAEIWPIISNSLDDLYRTCAVGTVTVAPSAATLQLGGAAGFNATWKAVDGQPLTTSDSVEWSVDSPLAQVSQGGRLVAGSDPGTVALQAKVRRTLGAAAITIADDSARATYAPPVVTVTERSYTDGPYHPGPIVCQAQAITIVASAMPGASIVSVELYIRTTVAGDSVIYEHYSQPLDSEFIWRVTACTIAGVPTNWIDQDNWYRLVVTDSHGRVTEKIGPNP
jgi:hypothetical protein